MKYFLCWFNIKYLPDAIGTEKSITRQRKKNNKNLLRLQIGQLRHCNIYILLIKICGLEIFLFWKVIKELTTRMVQIVIFTHFLIL